MTGKQQAIGQGLDAVSSNEKRESMWQGKFSTSDELALQTQRAISRSGRAGWETEDEDAAFISCWLAFNAVWVVFSDSIRLAVAILPPMGNFRHDTRLHRL